jgi:RNA polymerase sigma-70 factor (ECF subfamily)
VNNPAESEFVNRYGKLILSVVLKSGLSQAEADDILQQTCEKVHKSIRKFDYDPSKGRFRSWLYLIVKQRIADHYRKQKNFPPLPSPLNENSDAPFMGIEDPVDDWQQKWDAEYYEHLTERALKELQ